MKIAVFGDLHGHIYREFNKVTELSGSSRLDEQVKVLNQMKEECKERGIKHVMFAGDLHHTRGKIPTIVGNVIQDCLKTFPEEGIEMLMIPGNHDDADNSDLPKHSLHAFKEISGITVVDAFEVVDFAGQRVACVRYSKNTKMVMDFINSVEDEDAILLGHLGLSGAFVGKGSYPMQDAFKPSDLRPDFFKFIVLGHFHKKQYIEGRNNFLYTGSPLQHTFNDEGSECGFHILDTDTGLTEFVKIQSPEFHTLEWEQCNTDVLKDHAFNGDYLRIILFEDQVEDFHKIVPKNLNYKILLHKEYKEQVRLDVKVGMSEEEVVTKYAMEHNKKALDIGLKILAEVKSNVH